MTFPERKLERPLDPPEALSQNTQDVIPPTERNQDPERSMHSLVNESARPLTDEERKSADREGSNAGERVYAPATERVPKTVASYGDVVSHTDAATPERQAVAQVAAASNAEPSPSSSSHWPEAREPSFTRVPRPANGGMTGTTDGPYEEQPIQPNRWMSSMSGNSMLPFGMGWLGFGVCAGIGVWLWMRWQRERNKPINRLRRQARQAAAMARERMPEMPEFPDDAARPAVGLGTAMLSLAVLLWQQSQARSRSQMRAQMEEARSMKGRAQKLSKKARKQADRLSRQASDSVSDIDWQERLMQLRELWNPSRIELR